MVFFYEKNAIIRYMFCVINIINQHNSIIGDSMKKKIFIALILLMLITTGSFFIKKNHNQSLKNNLNVIEVIILEQNSNMLKIKDKNDKIYKINYSQKNFEPGTEITFSYKGVLDENIEIQNIEIISLEEKDIEKKDTLLMDKGIFSDYYPLAEKKIKEMTLEEKIAQLFLVRYTNDDTAADIQKKYQFGGYIFFKKDFIDKNKIDVKNMINKVQDVSKIPMLTAVDEEGGVVVRVSSNPKLVEEPFKSPSELFNEGGIELIKKDVLNKSEILSSLGINLNLAPVVDVATNATDYMYSRALQQNTEITAEYAKSVIESSKSTNVSYVLKHFPGYGNNSDTHTGEVIDNRSYESIIINDLPPFEAGIKEGAEAILVSHNVVVNIDKDNPASLSPQINALLRKELDFYGVIITDDLEMGAISNVANATVKAIKAGNDLIITTDYMTSLNAVKDALNTGTLTENQIDKAAQRIIAWKYYKGLIDESQK